MIGKKLRHPKHYFHRGSLMRGCVIVSKRTGIRQGGLAGLAMVLAFGCTSCATDPLLAINDKSTVRIVLHRDSYVVNVEGTGAVTFNGGIIPGYHSDQISLEAVNELIEKFRAANFFALDDKYVLEATDGHPVSIIIFVGDKRKEVVDYFGTQVGMPSSVTDLEKAIERTGGSDKWVLGGKGLVESLKRENFDFKSWPAIYALYAATRTGAPETVQGFIEAGTPIDDPRTPQKLLAVATARQNPEIIDIISNAGAGSNPRQLGAALITAARRGDISAMRSLIEKGASPSFSDEGQTVLMAAAQSGRSDAVAEVLKHKPDVNAVWHGISTRQDKTAVMLAVEAQLGEKERPAEIAQIVEMLADAGTNLDAQDMFGETALHRTAYAPIAEALLSRGANPNIRNKRGKTPMMRCQSEEVVEVLLRHGADISARDDRGMSILELAKANKWNHIVEELERRSSKG